MRCASSSAACCWSSAWAGCEGDPARVGSRPARRGAIYARELAAAKLTARGPAGAVVDAYAFTLAFKGVLLEGLEVAFIVLTFGANQHNIPLAATRRPPRSSSSSASGRRRGRRWPGSGELAEVRRRRAADLVRDLLGRGRCRRSWPGRDAALLGLVAFVLLGALAVCGGCAASAGRWPGRRRRQECGNGRRIRAFGAFWWDFIVGDDCASPPALVLALAGTAGLAAAGLAAWWLLPLIVALLLVLSLQRGAR